MTAIATVRGVALTPGVSKNGRLYSPEVVADAVRRAQARIDLGIQPLTMLTSHSAGDDSTHIVGQVTAMRVGQYGEALFEAAIADTENGRTIAALVAGERPFLRGVSIRGAWVGSVRQERGPDGSTVETADALELDGLDWTANPGVIRARVTDFERTTTESAGARRSLIYESVPRVMLVDEALPQLDLREVAQLGLDEFREHASGPWLAQRAERGRTGLSPFWRGLGGGGDAA